MGTLSRAAAWVSVLLFSCGAGAAPVAEPEVVDIPAGTFIRGSDQAEREFAYRLDARAYGRRITADQRWYEGELPRGPATTSSYSVTRTPITNRQYAIFARETGHRIPGVSRRLWQSYRLIHPFERTLAFAWNDGAPPAGREDHPVVLVSQDDARAYAAWLSRRTGMRWRLPSETEWEKAARGADGRTFPWGNQFDATRLNSHDAGPFDTVAAGSIASGASPFGVLDAAGQVYEWTSSAAEPGRAIVKGGSWDDRGCGVCRPAARHSRPEGLKHILIGFRLLREPLSAVARIGPWPAISALIGYRGRLWFANSVKYSNHNSADIYSYDPKSGALRYERHLFSQDAGQPAVSGGLLYWPFEDPRFSVGRGEFMLTNGRDWQWRSLPYPRVLHLHSMLVHGKYLYAATGGFFAALYRSSDKGQNWRPVYVHRNAPNSFSRLAGGQVPPQLLTRPWRAAPNRGEKYVETVAGAAWAVSESHQDDDATISALIARLGQAGDPDWLAGDLVGALTALTGCRFGYVIAAWRASWRYRERHRDRVGACDVRFSRSDLVLVPGGSFTTGDPQGEADEAPRAVTLKPFRMMRREVTNGKFRRFVVSTGHVTDPERSGTGYVWTDRWRPVQGANWKRPQGPKKGSTAPPDSHPAVQVSARDAAAYCAWRGLRLPREQEWEFAARGTDGRRYPWGNESPGAGESRRANYGADRCCAADASDGHLRSAPVGAFPDGRSAFGLDDMAGNVWEWTTSAYSDSGGDVAIRGGGWGNDPYGIRSSYRHGNPPDIGLDMVGFRCAGEN